MAVALIVAAGSGERLGAGRPKALVELGGRPLFTWSMQALRATSGVERVAIAMPVDCDITGEDLDIAAPGSPPVVCVGGGATRSESVLRALDAVGPGDPVVVHDAARALVTPALAESVIAALERDPDAHAAIAAMPVTDTIKRVGADGAVSETLERRELWAVQTPQVFRRAALEHARATDDAWLIERAGGKVIVVRGGDENLKVTTPLDLALAELLLARRSGVDPSSRPSA
jgi:2-C-methyl-D-erythritol 4-phosphate cytidylyltransferase